MVRVLLLFGVLMGLEVAAVQTRPTEFHWARVVLPGGVELKLEMAVTVEQRMLGYMHREHVADDEGMLFLFDSVAIHGIWMRNCKVSLDVLWLDANFRIVEIAPRLQPCPPTSEDPEARQCPVRQPMRNSSYVLEIAGGRAEALGLEAGQTMVVLSDPVLP